VETGPYIEEEPAFAVEPIGERMQSLARILVSDRWIGHVEGYKNGDFVVCGRSFGLAGWHAEGKR